MSLRGFGHGVAIGVEPDPGGGAWLYVEAKPKRTYVEDLCARVDTDACRSRARLSMGSGDGRKFGTAIARLKWHRGRTVTAGSDGVSVYAVNNHAPAQTASVDWRNGTLAIRFWSMRYGRFRYAIYDLGKFRQHAPYVPLARFDAPDPTRVFQGWTYSGTGFYRIAGNKYSERNPPPGNTALTQFDSDGVLDILDPETSGADLTVREPQGMSMSADRLCFGYASGYLHYRRANVFCKS